MSTNDLAFTSRHHVQNALWSKVDRYTLQHLHPKSRSNIDALRHALVSSRDNGLPDIATSPTFAKYMALQCKARGVKHALEVGTLGGYGSLWLATENPDMRVTTIEIDPKHKAVADRNLTCAGVNHQVTVRLGPGLEVLPKLAQEIQEGLMPKFGFVYLDADKENNWNYLDMLVPWCEPGACIFVDNMLQGGELANSKTRWPAAIGARSVVEHVGDDDRLDGIVLQIVGEKSYDAFLMAVVR